MKVRPFRIHFLVLLLATSGCAPYALQTAEIRDGLARTDYDGVLRGLSRNRKGPNRLLYHLEMGLALHYRGDYRGSNTQFDQAERVAEMLYTRSLSREAASLITNDAIRDYRGSSYELAFVHYYRALNYWALGLPEDALVECRKANLRLAREKGNGGSPSYRNDPFLQYLTGLFYESTGEWNDAYVSFREARAGYETGSKVFGLEVPPTLAEDLSRVAARLGYREEVGDAKAISALAPGQGELVLFCETGFILRKVQEEIQLPLFEEDLHEGRHGDMGAVARRIAGRYEDGRPGGRHGYGGLRPRGYPGRGSGDWKYWLRVAFPAFEGPAPRTRDMRITAAGRSAGAFPSEDLSAIALRTYRDEFPAILARTVTRAMSKYLATESLDRKNGFLGALANLFAVSTEVADTRSWASLPHSIRIARLALPAGVHDVRVECLDADGGVLETKVLPGVRIREASRTFLSWRTYQ